MTTISPASSLQVAISEFRNVLSDSQKDQLDGINSVPNADSVMIFTAQLDAKDPNRRGRSTATRLYSILESIQQFSSIVGTFVSSNPNIAALVWGSVQLTMLVVVNFTSYFEPLSIIFMGFNKHCPRFEEYRNLFPNSRRLQQALCDFHATIVLCCMKVVIVVRRPLKRTILSALWRSLEDELEPEISKICELSQEVEKQILLAKVESDLQEQSLQQIERQASSNHRSQFKSFLSHSRKEQDEFKKWQLQQDQTRIKQKQQRLLDSLSFYNPRRGFIQACQKRYKDTSEWLTRTLVFSQWKDAASSSVFLLSGKIGSGKTVLMGNVVSHLFSEMTSPNTSVTYFFPHSGNPMTLKADAILRAIARQLLKADDINDEIESLLEDLKDPLSQISQTSRLLQLRINELDDCYILVDALDEYEKIERDMLLKALSSFTLSSRSRTKLFITGRDSIIEEVKRCFANIKHQMINTLEAQNDISTYITREIEDKIANEELVIGDVNLVQEIQNALIKGAEGMFLWVGFQIQEICLRKCDEDIRKALENLPKDLKETFNRVLHRILVNGNENIAQQTFQWVSTAKRPLSLDELREALSVEPSQPYSNPARLINGIHRINEWCENFIELDEELFTVQFVHPSVRQHLLSDSSDPSLKAFHFQLDEADHYLGEICVTYLNFNDFKTTLSRRQNRINLPTPGEIVETTFRRHRLSSATNYILGRTSTSPKSTRSSVSTEQLASYSRENEESMKRLKMDHPFLEYASQYWLFHTHNFEDGKSQTWNLWSQMVCDGRTLAKTPWTHRQLVDGDPFIINWAFSQHNLALLRYFVSCHYFSHQIQFDRLKDAIEKALPELFEAMISNSTIHNNLTRLLPQACSYDCAQIIDTLLQTKVDVNAGRYNGRTTLQAAAERGHLDVVDKLLALGAHVNAAASDSGRTALQAAAGGGHLDVVNRLVAAGAHVNAAASLNNGRTALEAAAEGGHIAVVDKLLTVGAHVNGAGSGCTALQAAAGGGHLAVVDKLLAVGAHVNAAAAGNGCTALHAAAGGGHIAVVDKLLAVGADITASASHGKCTVLEAAAESGHLAMVDKLLTVGAHVNGIASHDGRTALQAAAEGGHLAVVNRLIAVGAHVNSITSLNNGRTALQAAAAGGHLDVVNKLLATSAHINDTSYDRHIALHAAAGGGHLVVVDKLLAVGADVNSIASHDGRTALQAAAEGGHLAVVNRLIAVGAHVNGIPSLNNGPTALQAAAMGGHLDVVNKLLAVGAHVNAPANFSGRTALQAAAEGGHLAVVNKLLAVGAHVNGIPSLNNGRTALQAAAGSGHLAVVDKLLAVGAHVNAAANFNGRTALQAAAEGGHIDVVNKLLAVGAHVNAAAANYNGRTALEAAAEGGHLAVVDRLKSATGSR